jgi:predicted nuclease of predicted toxin-antitoxin system
MKIVVDMNLSPDWVKVLEKAGWESVHWSTVGDMRATDDVIMSWARDHGYIVFTHDLDFGILLALTQAESPSVFQVRTQDVFPEILGNRLIKVLKEHQSVLEKGALLTVDEAKARVRVLPFG